MKIFFCSDGDEVHPLLLERWRDEVTDGHANHDGHNIVGRVAIEEPAILRELDTYMKEVIRTGLNGSQVPQGVIYLGYEAGLSGDMSGPMLSDFASLIDSECQGEIRLSTLMKLYNLGFREGDRHRRESA